MELKLLKCWTLAVQYQPGYEFVDLVLRPSTQKKLHLLLVDNQVICIRIEGWDQCSQLLAYSGWGPTWSIWAWDMELLGLDVLPGCSELCSARSSATNAFGKQVVRAPPTIDLKAPSCQMIGNPFHNHHSQKLHATLSKISSCSSLKSSKDVQVLPGDFQPSVPRYYALQPKGSLSQRLWHGFHLVWWSDDRSAEAGKPMGHHDWKSQYDNICIYKCKYTYMHVSHSMLAPFWPDVPQGTCC